MKPENHHTNHEDILLTVKVLQVDVFVCPDFLVSLAIDDYHTDG